MVSVLLLMCALVVPAYCAKDCCNCPKVCDLRDVGCITAGSNDIVKVVLAGGKDSTRPMNPLNVKEICSKDGSTQHTLTNTELKGLAKCVVSKLQMNVTNGELKMFIHCPELIATFKYEVNGKPACQDKVVVKVHDYDILNVGLYGVFVSPEDLYPHFFIKTKPPKVSVKVRTCEIKLFGDAATNQEITKQTGEYLISLIVGRAMAILFEGIDVVLRREQMGIIFPGSKSTKHCQKQ